MTKPRRKPATKFHAFVVEPQPGFKPSNWQQTPEHYRIVAYLGPKDFKGRADSWKFLHNHEALQKGVTNRWALYLDFETPVFGGRFASDENLLPLSNPARQAVVTRG